MHLHLICIGKLEKGAPEENLMKRYIERLPWQISIKELECKKNLPEAQLKEAEGQLLLQAIPANCHFVVVLDEHGKTPSTEALFSKWTSWQDSGHHHIAFLIGGAYGHASSVLNHAHYVLSLGHLTWPHKLVRAMLLEQIYRLYTLQTGHPYHK